jgi:uncharacterized protein (TIGR04222 family)
MNLFDLPGPQFLALYATLGVITIAAMYHLKQRGEAGEPGRLSVSDPYTIAYLRGGATEAVRLAVAVLVDRQLLVIGAGDTVTLREGVTSGHGVNELERAVLQEAGHAEHPSKIAGRNRLLDVANRSYEPTLLQLGLLAGPDVRERRGRRIAIALGVLIVIAAIKIVIGLARNRPVAFLVMSAIGFSVLAIVVTKGRRTVRGDRILGDLRVLFDALRHRAKELRPYSSTSELALLMAVFGLDAVPVLAFPFIRAFRPAASSTTDSGSSSGCGSSSSGGGCGGGGSSCGGGGGCGGCGSS